MKKKIKLFGAEWCGPCKTLKAQIESLPEDIEVEVIDCDTNQAEAQKNGIRGVPTLKFVTVEDSDVEGEEPTERVYATHVGVILNADIIKVYEAGPE